MEAPDNSTQRMTSLTGKTMDELWFDLIWPERLWQIGLAALKPSSHSRHSHGPLQVKVVHYSRRVNEIYDGPTVGWEWQS
jgi:hypothetical protein